jgi:hypothetical protein
MHQTIPLSVVAIYADDSSRMLLATPDRDESEAGWDGVRELIWREAVGPGVGNKSRPGRLAYNVRFDD